MSASVTGVAALGLSGDKTLEQRNYTVVYRVTTTSTNDGLVTVYNASGMPMLGVTPYQFGNEADIMAIARRKHSARMIAPDEWEVTVDYSTGSPVKRDQRDPTQWAENPLLRPVRWKYHGFSEDSVEPVDAAGCYFINSAGDPFPSEVATWKVNRSSLVLSNNYLNADSRLWDELRNTVNAGPFWTFDPGTVRLDDVEAEPQYENGIAFVSATFTFLVHPNRRVTLPNGQISDYFGWIRYVPDKGPRYWDGGKLGTGNKVFAKDDKGVFATEDVLLNNQGGKLADNAGYLYYKQFIGYKAADWSALQLE